MDNEPKNPVNDLDNQIKNTSNAEVEGEQKTQTEPEMQKASEVKTPESTKKPKKSLTLIAVLIGTFLIGGGAFAYKKIIIDNKPENVLSSALKKDYSDKRITTDISYGLISENDSAKNINNLFKSARLSFYQQKEKKLSSFDFSVLGKDNKKMAGLSVISDDKNNDSYFNVNLDSDNVNKVFEEVAKAELKPEQKESFNQVKSFKKQIVNISKKVNNQWYKSKTESNPKQKLSMISTELSCYNQKDVQDLVTVIKTTLSEDKNLVKDFEFKIDKKDTYNGKVFVLEKNGKEIVGAIDKFNSKIGKKVQNTKVFKCLMKESDYQEIKDFDFSKKTEDRMTKQEIQELEKISLKLKLYVNNKKELEKSNLKIKNINYNMSLDSKFEKGDDIKIPKKVKNTKELEKEIQSMVMNALFGQSMNEDSKSNQDFGFNVKDLEKKADEIKKEAKKIEKETKKGIKELENLKNKFKF